MWPQPSLIERGRSLWACRLESLAAVADLPHTAADTVPCIPTTPTGRNTISPIRPDR